MTTKLKTEPNLDRPDDFYAALIDEADSILIDEARVPLVIAGDEKPTLSLAYRVDEVTRHFRRFSHFTVDEAGRNIGLTDAGISAISWAGNWPPPGFLTITSSSTSR